MAEKNKCLKCGIKLFYKPKNKLSIAMCIECYYNLKNKPKINAWATRFGNFKKI